MQCGGIGRRLAGILRQWVMTYSYGHGNPATIQDVTRLAFRLSNSFRAELNDEKLRSGPNPPAGGPSQLQDFPQRRKRINITKDLVESPLAFATASTQLVQIASRK
jgi:hypothetical protein